MRMREEGRWCMTTHGRVFLQDQIFRWHVGAHEMPDRVDFGWLSLRIVRSINLCLWVDNFIKRTGFESCRGFGFDDGNSLLIVGIG